jgi:hypothetical protein
VGYQEADLPGMAADQVQSEHGAEAGAEHQSRLAGHRSQQPRGILAVGGDIDGGGRVADRAAGKPAPVVAEHRVVAGEVARECVGAVGVAALEQEQQRPAAWQRTFRYLVGSGRRGYPAGASSCPPPWCRAGG